MKRLKKLSFYSCFIFLLFFAACGKEGFKELKGTWMLAGKQSWLEGQPYQINEKYNFEEDKVIVTHRKFECSVYKDEYKTSMIFNLNLSDDDNIISSSLVDKGNNINLSFEDTYVAPV